MFLFLHLFRAAFFNPLKIAIKIEPQAFVGDCVSAIRVFQFETFSLAQASVISLCLIVLGRFVPLGNLIFGLSALLLVLSPVYLRFPQVFSHPFLVDSFPSLIPTTTEQVKKRHKWE